MKTLADFWDKAPPFFWAIAASSAVVAIILLAADHFAQLSLATPILISTCIFAVAFVFAIARWLQDRLQASFYISIHGITSFTHIALQQDGTYTTQIVVDMDIFNRTGKSQLVANVELVRPKSSAEYLHRTIVLQNSGTMKPSAIPRDSGGRFQVHIILASDLGTAIRKRGIKIVVFDGRGRRHNVRLRKVRMT